MISKLRIKNYRNFDEKLLDFSETVTAIVGPNASGKTNILESIYLLSSGKSFHARLEEEMINMEKDVAHVKARILDENGQKMDLEVILTRGSLKGMSGKISRKKFMVNNVAKRMIDFAGNTKMVLFVPADMDMVTSSPSLRRKFLDLSISQVDREYRRSLHSYEKGLRARNKLLYRIREEGLSRSQLLFWDQLLIKNGDYITGKREEYINFINATKSPNELEYKLDYDRSVISVGRLEQYKNEEVAAATTLVGPHRDDFIFLAGERNLESFGSRGEQRMAVLWVKLAELEYIKVNSDQTPTLILDDIFSELDIKHREQVMKMSQNHQTIMTTADPEFLKNFENIVKIDL
jgi:DNA replication and repair protein RecF